MPVPSSTNRTEAFSDGVFAIAITLLILEVKVPTAEEIAARGGLTPALLHHGLSMAMFVVTFATIGVIWLNHHQAFTHLAGMDRALQAWNLVLLAAVAFIPYPHAVVAQALPGGLFSADTRVALAFYGLAFVAATAPWVLIWSHVRRHPALMVGAHGAVEARRNTIRSLIGMAIYAVMALAGFLLPVLAIAGYAALAVFFAVTAGGDSPAANPDPKED